MKKIWKKFARRHQNHAISTLFPPDCWRSACWTAIFHRIYRFNLSFFTSAPPLIRVLSDPKVFHAVSNLFYLQRHIERVLVIRLNQRLFQNGLYEICSAHINKTAAMKQLRSKYKIICLWYMAHLGNSPHQVLFNCSIWYYRSYYTAELTASVGYRELCIKLVQIRFEPAETMCCYQSAQSWHRVF